MSGVFIIILIIIFLVLQRSLKERVKKLQHKVKLLTNDVEFLKDMVVGNDIELTISDKKEAFKSEKPQASKPPQQQQKQHSKVDIQKVSKDEEIKKSTISNFSKRVKEFEQTFVENWTGILGSIVMVAGVAFLGIYATLNVSAFYRFVLITGFSILLGFGFFYLKSIEKWKQFSFWLGSISAAIFLFACLGSGGISGLKWIDNSLLGPALLVFGITVNLLFAYYTSSQTFTSVHSVLSLVVLMIAPSNSMILVVASIVTALCILFSYRNRWDIHLLITILSYFTFLSVSAMFHPHEMEANHRIIAMICIVIVGVISALTHYRKDYKSDKVEGLPLFVHLTNWFCIGIALMIYSTGSTYRVIGIFLASILSYMLAKHGKRLGVRWVYLCDIIISQFILCFSIISLYIWKVDETMILGLLFIESMIFLIVAINEDEKILQKIGKVFLHFTTIVLIFWGVNLCLMIGIFNVDLVLATYMFSFIFGLLFHYYICENYGERFDNLSVYINKDIYKKIDISISGFLNMGILTVLFLLLTSLKDEFYYSEYIISAFLILSIWFAHIVNSKSLSLGITVSLTGIYFISFIGMRYIFQDLNFVQGVIKIAPLLFVIFLANRFVKLKIIDNLIRWPLIYLLGITILASSYQLFNIISHIIPGILWACFSIVFLEVARYFSKTSSKEKGNISFHLLNVALGFIIAFMIHHLLVHLQLEEIIGFIKIRFIIQLFGIGVFAYWLFQYWEETDNKYFVLDNIRPLFLELILLTSVLITFLEIEQIYHPIIWTLISISILLLGITFNKEFSRLRFYSLMFSWGAMIHVAVTTSIINSPSSNLSSTPWLIGVTVILIQFVYLVFLAQKPFLEIGALPKSLLFLDKVIKTINAKKLLWIYYPFFVSIAIFLFWRFDKSFLTLLWVFEAFIIFTLGIALKENHFRILSLSIIFVCLVRLVFYDLAQAEALMRGLVFFGVGAIMLTMNAIYNKFKDRLQ